MFFLQVDPTGIIQGAAEVRPDDGSAYGWLIVLLMGVLCGVSYVSFLLWKKVNKEQDKKEVLLEKSLDVHRASADAIGDLSEKVNEVVMEQKVHTALLQKGTNNG